MRLLNQGWVASLIGLAGLVIGFIFFVKSRARPRLVYQRRALQLIGSAEPALPGEVEVSYKGVTVPRLTATYIVLWNAGIPTVRGSDVVASDPLRFVFPPGTRVLQARVVKATRPVIGFDVTANPNAPNEALLTFDFLDIRDGAVVEILHTSEERYPQVQGTIRGLPEGLRDWGRVVPAGNSLRVLPALFDFRGIGGRLILVLLAVYGVGLALYGIASPTWAGPSQTDAEVGRWSVVAAGAVLAGLAALLGWRRRRRFPRNLVTDELA